MSVGGLDLAASCGCHHLEVLFAGVSHVVAKSAFGRPINIVLLHWFADGFADFGLLAITIQYKLGH